MAAQAFHSQVLAANGSVELDRLAKLLHVSSRELALAVGLPRHTASEGARLADPNCQARLRDVVEIISRVLPWAGSVLQAFAWYRSQPLPSFGDRTAEDLVKEGQADAVKAYLSRIAVGGNA